MPWLESFGARKGPFPLTVELGGQIQRHDPQSEALMPGFADEDYPAALNIFATPQDDDLDWGDGRDVKVTYRPAAGPWSISAGVRYGKTNGTLKSHAEQLTDPVCAFGGPFAFVCDYEAEKYEPFQSVTILNHADSIVRDREEHTLIDFVVGRDLGLGQLQGSLSAGLRHAKLESTSFAVFRAMPDWDLQEGFFTGIYDPGVFHTRFDGEAQAEREFEGTGPVVTWAAALPLFGDDDMGHLALDWSVTGGALFGKQETAITGSEKASYFETRGLAILGLSDPDGPFSVVETPLDPISRSDSVTVPTAALSLGFSYEVGRFGVGAGYRWERYFDAIDGGFETHEDADRTIDGPYFKLSVGFGG